MEIFNPNPDLDIPWRKFDWRQKEVLKKKLENFSPSNPNVKDLKILVAGQVGAGKSSFINSIESVFQGRICSRAPLTGFSIRSGRKSLPFIFMDTMGLQPEALAGSQPDDIINAVFGHVKDGYKFNQEQALTHKDQHYTCDPTLSDQAFCLVYVIDGNTVQLTDDKLIDKLKIICQRISDQGGQNPYKLVRACQAQLFCLFICITQTMYVGIPQVVVMTKVDEACPLVNNDLRKIYSSKKIKEKMKMCSDKTGVPMSNIFPVKNYYNVTDTEDDIDVLILKALEQIVQMADDRLLDCENY